MVMGDRVSRFQDEKRRRMGEHLGDFNCGQMTASDENSFIDQVAPVCLAHLEKLVFDGLLEDLQYFDANLLTF
jgi:hypothetical protein